MILKRLSAILLCAAVFVSAGCDSKKATSPSAYRNVKIAQWGQERYLIYLPVYLAQSQGFFEKHNIHADLLFSGNDDQVFATVVRGDAQFGVGDPIFTAISTQRGLPGVEVASIVGRVGVNQFERRQVDQKLALLVALAHDSANPDNTASWQVLDLNRVTVEGAELAEAKAASQ